MNANYYDVLLSLSENIYQSQKELSIRCGLTVNTVSNALKHLREKGLCTKGNCLTDCATSFLEKHKPQRAIILAAGFGMRMVPINTETPKALLSIRGEILIERLIRQLQEVDIKEIFIIVGFMKERFEYLRDTFGVNLIYNPQYSQKNNLHSLSLALRHLSNVYIVPGDLWCEENPFHHNEIYSWYMVSDSIHKDSTVVVNKNRKLLKTKNLGNRMIGISYLSEPESDVIKANISHMLNCSRYDNAFWEAALYSKDRMLLYAKIIPEKSITEINTYEQLRTLDSNSSDLKSDAIETIKTALSVEESEIKNISVLKKGMTNRSFLFYCKDKKYIMRIPGEGTDRLINRRQEAKVYTVLNGKGICDDVVYINPENGYKITEFLEGARVCDPFSMDDIKKVMNKLRKFHNEKMKVSHIFDIFEQIQYYEDLWDGVPSDFRDYATTKEQVLSLRSYIDTQSPDYCLTHIDAVADNFLFVPSAQGEEIRLIDWEYAGMQDPHVDIAMFCIYALYDREHIDSLIDLYFEGNCPQSTRAKIYCYIAACGLLWSNWCEYKRILGVEFGEYSLQQYIFAKEYSKIAKTAINSLTQ